MKKLLIFIALSLPIMAFSQTEIGVAPISFIAYKNFSVTLEQAFAEDISLSLHGAYSDDFADNNRNLFSTDFSLRYYFFPEKPISKFWFSAYFKYALSTTPQMYASSESDIDALIIGYQAGYKWLSARGVYADLGFGGGRAIAGRNISDLPFGELDLIFLLNFGYRF